MLSILNKQITVRKALLIAAAGKIIFDTVFVESREVKYNEANVEKAKAPFIFLKAKIDDFFNIDANQIDEEITIDEPETADIFASSDDGINKLN